MYALAIIAALVCCGCLAAIVVRNMSFEGFFWWYPDYAKELNQTDKRLAIVSGVSFLVFIVSIVLGTS